MQIIKRNIIRKYNELLKTLLEEGDSVSQTFSTDSDLLALAFVFTVPGEQPSGTLELTLADADTGETLAASTGEMAYIVPGQYTGLGLDRTVEGREGGRYSMDDYTELKWLTFQTKGRW